MNSKKLSQEQLNNLDFITKEISNMRTIHDLDKFDDIMKTVKEKSESIPLLTIQKFAILFFSFYNNIVVKEQIQTNQKLIQLADFMLHNFTNKDLLKLTQNEIDRKFSEEDFKNCKIFADKYKEKEPLEICFEICILSKNINIMKIFFTEYLNVNVLTEDKFCLINLDNPIAFQIFVSLFNKIFVSIKNNKLNDLDSIIQNIINDSNNSLYNMFRCSKCYDIMLMRLKIDNKFEMKCLNCDTEYKEYTQFDANKTFFSRFKCAICGKELLLIEENYKCVKCKNLFCQNCKSIHLKNCFSLNCIKLYEVGYRCETHYCKYIGYCFYCQKNICKICKEIHPHIIKEVRNIDNDIKEFMKKYNKLKQDNSLKSIPNGQITKYLSLIYISMSENKFFNGNIYLILCELLKLILDEGKKNNNNDNNKKNNNDDKNVDNKNNDNNNNNQNNDKDKDNNILFKNFNGKEFEEYYSELLNKIKDGNIYYFNCFNSIKSLYEEKNKIEFKYDQFNFIRREILIQKLIERCISKWKNFDNIHRMIDYGNSINELKMVNNNLNIKITKLNSRILILENSNHLLQENIHNILCRFLADKLLQTIIVNYYKFLEPVSLNLNIFLDIVSKGNNDILSNKIILETISVISNELSDKLNQLKNNPNNKELQNNIIKLLSSSSKIHFIKDVVINEEIIKKEELNQILDILFFIKDFGNITAHPNININESMKMLSIQSLPLNFEIEQFYNNNLKDIVEKKINKNVENNIVGEIGLKFSEFEDDNYYHLYEFNNEIRNNYDLFKNLEDYRKGLNDNIINKLKEIRDNLLKSFNIGKIKKKVKIEDIIETIFNDKDTAIYEDSKDLIKVLFLDTENVIKKSIAINLETELSKQNDSIKDLIEALEEIPLTIKDFLKLNIPRHNNLEEYIINNNDNNYSKSIRNFENRLYNEKNLEIDCEKNEIILEACILLLIKTYEKENKYLKSIQKKNEMDIIKNLVLEDIDKKLNEIYLIFEQRYSINTRFKLIEAILSKFKLNDLGDIKTILIKLINKDIALDNLKNSKLNIISKLFSYQNE